jgi:23S rRNA (cytosine1962-C5)-methyltransferase
MRPVSIVTFLSAALKERQALLDPQHLSVVRLFNGFLEGDPDLVVDIFADTLVLYNNGELPQESEGKVLEAGNYYLNHLPWLRTIITKTRHAGNPKARRGRFIYGEEPARRIYEEDTWYALDLLLNQDASFYPDTRNLRLWAHNHLAGKQVLNAFAYTGSLGVAAMSGGANRVLHVDRNRTFLNVAKTSYT